MPEILVAAIIIAVALPGRTDSTRIADAILDLAKSIRELNNARYGNQPRERNHKHNENAASKPLEG